MVEDGRRDSVGSAWPGPRAGPKTVWEGQGVPSGHSRSPRAFVLIRHVRFLKNRLSPVGTAEGVPGLPGGGADDPGLGGGAGSRQLPEQQDHCLCPHPSHQGFQPRPRPELSQAPVPAGLAHRSWV